MSTGTITYLISDELGSVRGAVSSTGALTTTTAYDAWGNPETAGGLTATTPFGFAGGYTDGTNLIYFINRYYNPATGQFISIDPAVSQTLEAYGYADGDPVSVTDPTGLEAPGDWAVSGNSCDSAHAWCNLLLGDYVKKGDVPTDQITVRIKVNPGAVVSKVSWQAQYTPDSHHFSRVHLNAYTLCYSTRVICEEIFNYAIDPTGHGTFPMYNDVGNLRGDLISHAFTLSAYCEVCGGTYATYSKRTEMARCNKTNNACIYGKQGKA